MEVIEVSALPNGIDILARIARDEGHNHIDRLVNDFVDGTNRFDRPGEALFACLDANILIGIGGINRDPYITTQHTARVRRVFIHPSYRKSGAGSRLMTAIERHAAKYFATIQLFTTSQKASAFYKALGYDLVTGVTKVSHAKALTC